MNDQIAEPFINPPAEKPPHEDFETVGDRRYYHRLQQGCDEWLELRMGMVTASEVSKLLTPTLKLANNETSRNYVYEMAAKRMHPIIEPNYIGFDMERGHTEEVLAKIVYAKHYEPVKDCGFIINSSLGFPVGCSPDGLIGDDGLIEVKSRANKLQVKTIIEGFDVNRIEVPKAFMLQIQAQLWVSGRGWCDFVSYSNGFNMFITRVFPDAEYFEAIEGAVAVAEEKIKNAVAGVMSALDLCDRWHQVEYYNHHEDIMA